jgi:hypothetical protein
VHQTQSADAGEDLKDRAYHANDEWEAKPQFSAEFSRDDWLADSGTTSHISNLQEDFYRLYTTHLAGNQRNADQSV